MTESSLTFAGIAHESFSETLAGTLLTMKGCYLSSSSVADEPHGPSLPDWQGVAISRLAELERLAPNWDGYGGLPVSRLHANRALRFLEAVMKDSVPMPDIVPLTDGGVQLEWYSPAVNIDFITESEEPAPVLLITTPAGETQEFRGEDIHDGVRVGSSLLAAD